MNDLLLIKLGQIGHQLNQAKYFQKRANPLEEIQYEQDDEAGSEDTLSPDQILVNAMNENENDRSEQQGTVSSPYSNLRRPSYAHGTSTDFFHENEDLPLGPTFTLMPPYISI